MFKYIWSIFYIILILNHMIINVESDHTKNECIPHIEVSCSHNCCKKKLSFVQNCWEHYNEYKQIILNYSKNNNDLRHDLLKHETGSSEQSESMPMSFQFSTHTIILFRLWETLSVQSYYFSLVICFIFGLISVMLKVLRLYLERSFPKTEDTNLFKSKILLRINTIRMLLSFVIYSWDYLLMLIVMTFNVGLFLSVILGLAFGFFLFGNHFVTSKKCLKNNIDVHKQFHGDPACCGC